MSNMSIVLHQFHSLVRLLISKPLAIGRGFRDWMAELAPEAGSEDEWSVFSSMNEWRYVFSHSGGSTNYEFVECIICICLHHVSKLWPVEMWSHCCLGIESLESRKSKGSLNPCADCSDCFLEEAKLPLDWKTLDNKYFRQLGLPRCSCFGFIFPSSQRSDLRFKCSNWISNTNGLNGLIPIEWVKEWTSEWDTCSTKEIARSSARVASTFVDPRGQRGNLWGLEVNSWHRKSTHRIHCVPLWFVHVSSAFYQAKNTSNKNSWKRYPMHLQNVSMIETYKTQNVFDEIWGDQVIESLSHWVIESRLVIRCLRPDRMSSALAKWIRLQDDPKEWRCNTWL